jgi:hypothetical protein
VSDTEVVPYLDVEVVSGRRSGIWAPWISCVQMHTINGRKRSMAKAGNVAVRRKPAESGVGEFITD